jgi:DNA-binding CsgD family transcriptional regulator/PAS domain-containing protein
VQSVYQAIVPAIAGCTALPQHAAGDDPVPLAIDHESQQLLGQLSQVLGPMAMSLRLDRPDGIIRLAETGPRGTGTEDSALRFVAPLGSDGRLSLHLWPADAASHGRLTAAQPFIELTIRAHAAAMVARGQAERHIAGLETALDQSIYAIMLLGYDGALLFANQAARRLLDASDGLRRSGRTVSSSDLGDAVKLQVAIDHVCRGEAHQGEQPVVALRRRNGRRPLLACVSPVQDRGPSGSEASAVLRIVDPDCRVGPLIEPVCAHYRLSAVESRLACFIATGLTLEEAATQLRIKEQTARSYLKQVFLKTETNRQADLVRLLLSSAIRTLSAGRLRFI